MIVFQIQITNFVIFHVDMKREAPVPGNAKAPCSFATASECVRLPSRQDPQFLRGIHVVQVRQNFAEFIRFINSNTFGGSLRVELLQSLMDEVPYLHSGRRL